MTARLSTAKVAARQRRLQDTRAAKMARSTYAYVRGNAAHFYEWLDGAVSRLSQGPAIWICGDCHTGNLGPVANASGRIDLQIRDLDQTVIGNPVHDLIRLGLSMATAARSSALSGRTTLAMIEALFAGYLQAFDGVAGTEEEPGQTKPRLVRIVMRDAMRRSWKRLSRERLENATLAIPHGKRFWPLDPGERAAIELLFHDPRLCRLATKVWNRPDRGEVSFLDAAYWVKGCSSPGRLRYAVLLDIDGEALRGDGLCLFDIKEGARPAAPSYRDVDMPSDNAQRVVAGARHLAPLRGDRMLAATLLERSVVIRELLPQDLKLEIRQISESQAILVAHYLANVVGQAHARQMGDSMRRKWQGDLCSTRSKSIDAPLWLWRSTVELVGKHESAYLEHCRMCSLTGNSTKPGRESADA